MFFFSCVPFGYCSTFRDASFVDQLSYFNGSQTLGTFPRKYMLGVTENATLFNSSYANNYTFTRFLVNLEAMKADQDVSPLDVIDYGHPLMIAVYSVFALMIAMPFSA